MIEEQEVAGYRRAMKGAKDTWLLGENWQTEDENNAETLQNMLLAHL